MFTQKFIKFLAVLCILKLLFILENLLKWLPAFVFYYIMDLNFYITCLIDYIPGLSSYNLHLFGYRYTLYLQKGYLPISVLIYDINYVLSYVIFILQVMSLVVITIWARAAGPRFRLDQLLSLTWKDLFIYLSLFLLFLIIVIIIV